MTLLKKKSIRKPITSGVAKVPVIMQMEALECGAASLAMVLAYFGRYEQIETIRKECGVSRDGSNLKSIYLVAQRYGLEAKAFRYEIDSLRTHGTFPCIIHWEFNHFVVLNGFRGNKAIINDPGRGLVKVSMEEFDRCFTGICLMLSPTDSFEPGGKPASVLAFARDRLRGTTAMFLIIILTTLIASATGILMPAFSRLFMDHLLTGDNVLWQEIFNIVFLLTALMQLTAAWIKAVYLLKLQGKMAIVANTGFVWHILRLPVEFFAQRMVSDVVERQSSNQDIANTLLSTLAPVVLDFATMMFYLALMVSYSPLLAMIGMASVAANLLLSHVISTRRVNITRVQMRDAASLNGTTISGIDMIETIKASGAEKGFFTKWAGLHAQYNDQVVKYAKLNQHLGQIPALISMLTANLVLYLGVSLIMQGEWTAGLVMAFNGYLSAFTAPATSLIKASQSMNEMRTNMERVQDVLKYPVDVEYNSAAGYTDTSYLKLNGNIELRNVTFGYNSLKPPLIEDFSLSVKRGHSVALVGGSGSGKSTLAKLITGLYKPWHGNIFFDGKPLESIDKAVFTSSVACVSQDAILFEDTVANNIKMWDRSIEDFEMILAARDAQIHDDIMQRTGGYDSMVTDGGRNFSGGQRQRMEIARALAQDPTLIIMDEATAALDAETEHRAVHAITERGITQIIVSHRLSTVRDCDEIIVLRDGKVLDRGTHSQLFERCDYYAGLITNE